MYVRKIPEKEYDLYIGQLSQWKCKNSDRGILGAVKGIFCKESFPPIQNEFLAKQLMHSMEIQDKRHVYFFRRQFIACCLDQKILAVAMIEEAESFVDLIYLCVQPESKKNISCKIVGKLVFEVLISAEKVNKKLRYSPVLDELQIGL